VASGSHSLFEMFRGPKSKGGPEGPPRVPPEGG
jgi:hypothetical protein